MALDAHLVELSERHRALDRKIEEEQGRPTADDAQDRGMEASKTASEG